MAPNLVAFYDTLGTRRTYSRLKPPAGPDNKTSEQYADKQSKDDSVAQRKSKLKANKSKLKLYKS